MRQEEADPLQVHWPEPLRLWSERMSDYYRLPDLFLPAFPALETFNLQPLMRFTRLFASSILLQDELVDGDLQGPDISLGALRVMAMQFEGYHLLHPLIPAERPFWGRFRTFLSDYARACLEERRFTHGQRPWSEYSEDVARQLMLGKNGISRVVVAALVELGDADSLYAPVVQSLDHFNMAAQLYDDLSDWKEDLRDNTPSLLLRRLVGERPPDLDDARLRRLARDLYYGGHASHVMHMAVESLNAAAKLSEHVASLPWYATIESLRRKCQGILDDVERVVKENLQRARIQPRLALQLPAEQGPWQRLAGDGLIHLHRQWQQGFGEARDLMKYPKELGLSVGSSCVQGDVFQRALILDALCDAAPMLGEQLRPLLAHEARYLVESRAREGFGGWRYFVDLPDLPPDTDDLAQVMQALLRAGFRGDVVEHCEPPLQVLLRDGGLPDGSFETWMVPATGRTPLQERHAELVQRVWGSGSDADVMANLLFALHLYDSQRFVSIIERGREYLEHQQRQDGTWPSRWYSGPYYGIHVALRLFALSTAPPAATEKALEFLRRSQGADGGWGLPGRESDALSTSLALLPLALSMRQAASTADVGRALRALEFLKSRRGPEGDWPATQLIHVGMKVFHGSRTLTTSFVVKAALAWHALLER